MSSQAGKKAPPDAMSGGASLFTAQSQRSGLNRRPLDYESSALPLSYAGRLCHALARTRTATPCGTTPSRWRVYQFHHQGDYGRSEGRRSWVQGELHSLGPRTFDLGPALATGPTGLEPATSRVTVECSNQTELRPQLLCDARPPAVATLVHSGATSIARRGIEPLSAP
jgi:hypothetical protein